MKLRALLFEDSEPLRVLIRSALRRDGVEVEETSVQVDLAAIPEIELAIVGAYEPMNDALQLIENLAQRKHRPAIVAITINNGSDTRKRVVQAGADRVIPMPFGAADLRTAACASTRDRGYQ